MEERARERGREGEVGYGEERNGGGGEGEAGRGGGKKTEVRNSKERGVWTLEGKI